MDDNNERRDLYEEFETEIVKNGNTEAFFDEDDLIEIYDFASDYDNYIVKVEVLLYGAVHYPKSEALATRRAWLYYSFGDTEAGSDFNKRAGKGTTLNRLLDLRTRNSDFIMDKSEFEAAFAEILAETDDFEDEALIQFTDYAMEVGLSDWLMANKEAIVAKCSYPQTFLYEFAQRAKDGDDLATATALFEELTLLEPFTLDFWICLASTQLAAESFADAVSSADYALAIDPDSVLAMRIKGTALFQMDHDRNEIVSLYERIVASPDALEADMAAYGAALFESGRRREAIDTLKNYLLALPFCEKVARVLMAIDLAEAEPFVRKIMNSDAFTEQDAISWAHAHYLNREFSLAAFVCLLFDDIKGIKSEVPFLVEICYYSDRFEEITRIFKSKNVMDDYLFNPSVVVASIMSFVRTDRRGEALAIAEDALKRVEAFRVTYSNTELSTFLELPPATSGVLLSGYMAQLENIIRALKAPSVLPPDDFDPMK